MMIWCIVDLLGLLLCLLFTFKLGNTTCGSGSHTYISELSEHGLYYRVGIINPVDATISKLDASDYCMCEYGTDLASITTNFENDEAFGDGSFFNSYGDMWIGLSDVVEGSFLWDDGSSYDDYTKWQSGQPNNWEDQDCVVFNTIIGEWGDCDCGGEFDCKPKAFICNAQTFSFKWDKIELSSPNEEYYRVGLKNFRYVSSTDIFLSKEMASDLCFSRFGTNLASITSESENSIAFGDGTFFNDYGYMWIGLSDSEEENTFVWDDVSSSYSYNKWKPGQPNNFNNQDCVLFSTINGEWGDCGCSGNGIDCLAPNAFVCNGKDECDISPISSAGDYIYDKELSDDGRYYRVGITSRETGHSGNVKISKEDASSYCQCKFGTQLASIMSNSENEDAMGDLTFFEKYSDMWIGYTDLYNEGEFIWDDGSFSLYENYNNWAPNQPNNWHNNQHCTVIDSINGEWGDCRCSGQVDCTPAAFLCNAQPSSEKQVLEKSTIEESQSNLLCLSSDDNLNSWSAITGNWLFENDECSISILSESGEHNVVWIGSHDGQVASDKFNSHSSFLLESTLILGEGGGSAGIYFGSNEVLSSDGNSFSGSHIFVGINEQAQFVRTGKFVNGDYISYDDYSMELLLNTTYVITVEVYLEEFYSVFINGKLIFEDIKIDISDGTIGLRSYSRDTKYLKLNLIKWVSNDISCINVFGEESCNSDGCESDISCPNGYTMTGCSAQTFGKNLDGYKIENNKCIAINGNDGDGVYASARCCKIHSNCFDSLSLTWSDAVEDKSKTKYAQCGVESNIDKNSVLTSCTMAAEKANLQSVYGINDESNRYTSSLLSTGNKCTGHRTSSASNDESFEVGARCCTPSNEDTKLKCFSKWSSQVSGTGNDDLAITTCPSGWFLSSCSTDSVDGNIDGAYFSKNPINGNDWCVAQNGKNGDGVYAVAVCCQEFSALRVLSSAVPQGTKAIIKDELGDDLLGDGLSLRSSLGSVCGDIFGISDDSISQDSSGIIEACCLKLDYNHISINYNNGKASREAINSYKDDFLDCILSMVDDIIPHVKNDDISLIEHFKLYNLFNDYEDRNVGSSVCTIGSTTLGYDYTSAVSITDSILTSNAVVSGMLGVATGSTGNKKLARATAFAGGVSNLLGVGFGIASLAGVPGFGSNEPNLEKIINDIYENVFRVVSEMFEESWDCTYNFVVDMTNDLEESVLSQLHLGEIQASIENVNRFLIDIADSNEYINDSMVLDEYTNNFGITIWDELFSVVTSFWAEISHPTIQHAIIPLIQTAMNQRITVYTRYVNLVLNLTNKDISQLHTLDPASNFGQHSASLFDKYEEYFSGAYFDILTNMQESSYNEIVSEINMLFNGELFCNWMYFVTLYSSFGGYPDLKWCHIDICDCDAFFDLADEISIGTKNSSDLDNFYIKIKSSFTRYFLFDVYFVSSWHLNYFGDTISGNLNSDIIIHKDYMSDLFPNANSDEINYIATKMHDYYISKFDWDWSPIVNNGEGADDPDIDACYHESYKNDNNDKAKLLECGDISNGNNLTWYSSNNEFLSFVYQSNPTIRMQHVTLMDMLKSDGGSCEYDTCSFTNSIYDFNILAENNDDKENDLTNFYVDLKNEFKCSDNSGDVIGARYITKFTNSTSKLANFLGIEILCQEGENLYFSGKDYNLFNFDNRNVLIGFNPSNIGEYEWSPWFICPKQHKLEISFGSEKECLTCIVKKFFDNDLEGYYKRDFAAMYDYHINYRCLSV